MVVGEVLAVSSRRPLRAQEKMPTKGKVKIWTGPRKPRPAKFFLSNREQNDGETLRIQQWLDLADIALEQTGEDDKSAKLPFKRAAKQPSPTAASFQSPPPRGLFHWHICTRFRK